MRWRTGYYYPAENQTITEGAGQGAAVSSPATGTCWVAHLYIPLNRSIGVTRLGCYNGNITVDTTKIRLGIYELDSDLKPSTLIVDAGTITKDATAIDTIRPSSASPFTEVVLGPNKHYFVTSVLEAAHAAGAGWHAQGQQAWGCGHPFGLIGDNSTGDAGMGAPTSSTTPMYTGITTGGLPTPLSTAYPINCTSAGPQVWMYVNSVTYTES